MRSRADSASREVRAIYHVDDICRRLRRDIIQMVASSQSGHPGGSLGAVELMAVLYFERLRHRPDEPDWEERDRFVLSNGHICPVLYACLARTGYFPAEELLTFRRIGSRLQGHPSRVDLPGIETSSGPLGQGLSIAVGMALGARMARRASRVYCLVGDGEMQEGQFWEAAMTAGHYRIDGLLLVVSDNGLQIDGEVDKVKRLEPVADKLRAFGWAVESIDGHDVAAIRRALDAGANRSGAPTAVIARTIMGKGVSFMENRSVWHGKAPTLEEARLALEEIGASPAFSDLPFDPVPEGARADA